MRRGELKCETLTCDSLSNLRLVGGWRHSRGGGGEEGRGWKGEFSMRAVGEDSV